MTKKLLLLFLFLFNFNLLPQDSTSVIVGPGFKFHSVTKPGPFNIRILEIDISNNSNKVKAVLSRDVLGTGFEKTSSLAKRHSKSGHLVIGAINGDYFGISEPNNPYTFLASSMIQNKEFNVGKATGIRTLFGMNDSNKPVFDIIHFSGNVKTKLDSSRYINSLNQQRSTDHMVLFNKYFGISTQTNTAGAEVRLQPIDEFIINNEMRFIVTEKTNGVGNMNINNDYILSGHGVSRTFINNNIFVGDTLNIKIGTNTNEGKFTDLMGGGPRLINNGIRPSSFVNLEGFGASHVNDRHPRTAVGINQDSSKVYFVTVDGRQPSLSVGMNLTELADYMISIGCFHAINLDGGGSTTMVVRNEIVNSPSDPGGERSNGNSLLAVAEVPVNLILSQLTLSPRHIIIDSTQTKKILTSGIDIWGYQVEVDPTDVTWQVQGINGTVDSLGFFIPFESGSGIIIGTVGAFSDTIIVEVQSELVPVWTFSTSTNNLPTWFSPSGSTERGLAFGVVNGIPRLYVVNRPNALILNPTTGDHIGNLSVTGISGGAFSINDIEVSNDGIIFAANLTTAANTSPFKVYKWDNESSTPSVVLEFNGTAGRLGDKFTVVGNFNNNTAIIYAAEANSNKVYKWTMSSGSFNQTPETITLSGLTNVGTSPAVYPRGLGNSNIFVNGNSIRPIEFTPSGTQVAAASTSVVDSRSNSMRYFESGTKKYLIIYQYGFPNENAQVLDISNGLANAVVLETTPSLGTNVNTTGTSGDIALRHYAAGRYIYYVLATNNGFAAYQIVNEEMVPVELTSFNINIVNGFPLLEWETATETNNLGFEIQRTEDRGQMSDWKDVGFVDGNGTTTENKKYSYLDKSVNSGSFKYRLKQVDFDGTFSFSQEIEFSFSPKEFSLSQNYPNPFNPSTVISFQLAVDSKVLLKIFDVLGNEVKTLLNENKSAGKYSIDFDGSSFPSGVYFYQLTAGSFISTKKMLLLK